jgi:dsRNA-specific ribonuclease
MVVSAIAACSSALTQSRAAEDLRRRGHNESLGFLGDAVLGW